jgi:hypothetical protein
MEMREWTGLREKAMLLIDLPGVGEDLAVTVLKSVGTWSDHLRDGVLGDVGRQLEARRERRFLDVMTESPSPTRSHDRPPRLEGASVHFSSNQWASAAFAAIRLTSTLWQVSCRDWMTLCAS